MHLVFIIIIIIFCFSFFFFFDRFMSLVDSDLVPAAPVTSLAELICNYAAYFTMT